MLFFIININKDMINTSATSDWVVYILLVNQRRKGWDVASHQRMSSIKKKQAGNWPWEVRG